jgi:NTP pyrophosphatase (non-canonical NTP hydrolase)
MTTTLTFAALRATNVARCVEGFRQPLSAWSRDEWCVAIGGEVGEALNLLKKINRAYGGYAGNSKTIAEYFADLSAEIADVVIYLDLFLASEQVAFFAPSEGIVDFAALERMVVHAANTTPQLVGFNRLGRHLLTAAGRLAYPANSIPIEARSILWLCAQLSQHAGFDLAAAITTTFNRTSEKIGAPHRLELTELAA